MSDYTRSLRRLRLLLQREIAWLRMQWRGGDAERFQGAAIGDAQVDLLLADDADARTRFEREEPSMIALDAELRALDEPHVTLLDELAETFALSPFERDVVLLCLAPELDPAFELLFAYVHDDAARRAPTPHLALSLFARDDSSARASFAPDGPLRRYALLHVEPSPQPLSTRALRLDDRVTDHLLGIRRDDETLAPYIRLLERGPLAAEHETLAARIAAEARSSFAVNLTGPASSGKETLAHAIAEHLRYAIRRLDARRLPPAGIERTSVLRALERESRLLRIAYFVQWSDDAEAAMHDVVETLDAPLVVDTRDPWSGMRRLVVARVARPDRHAQQLLWIDALSSVDASLRAFAEELVQQFDFSPERIARVARAAAPRASARELWSLCQQQVSWRIDDLAQRVDSRQPWDALVLEHDHVAQLRELASQVAQRARVYERWGFAARMSRGRGITALFAGPSGTGKTMAAEILAGELGLELYRIDLAGVVSKYIGESEKNLRRVFDAAEQSGAILFFDEADALFGKRTEVKDSHDLYANIQVNYLLQRMEDYRGLAILATNRKSALDRAFLRRLRFIVDFPFPDPAARERIWRASFPATAPVGSLDFGVLSRMEIAGGNIRNIALNAAFLAASNGGVIEQSHVLHAARREFAKIDRIAPEAVS
jgi:adenylylsulfate kinase-like enzyme